MGWGDEGTRHWALLGESGDDDSDSEEGGLCLMLDLDKWEGKELRTVTLPLKTNSENLRALRRLSLISYSGG